MTSRANSQSDGEMQFKLHSEKEIIKLKELTIGFMSTQDLASWFGVSYGTFRNKKKQKLKELEEYAEFEEKYGGVNITDIITPIYITSKEIDDAYYLAEIMSKENGLSSVAGMARKLMAEKKEYENLSFRAVVYRLSASGYRQFGKVTPDRKGVGTEGERDYIWAVKLDDYNNYREMDDEEREIYLRIRDSWAGAQGEIQERQALFSEDEDYWSPRSMRETLEAQRKNFYTGVISVFRDETGL